RRRDGARAALTPLALHERAVFADEQLEMFAFFVGELEEDRLAFRLLELLAVLLEEAVRAALALDADQERLLIVAGHQPLGAFREDAVGRALEEEERGARFELWIALQQLRVPRFELAEVLLLFFGQVLEHLARPRVARHAGGAGVELEAAALGRDRDAERVAREHEIRVAVAAARRPAGAALLAGAVDLHHALRGREAARR